MAVTRLLGFEAGEASLDGFTASGTAAYSTAQARTGARSFRCNPASGASGFISSGGGGPIYNHFGLYIATMPSVTRIIYGDVAGTANLRLNANGTLAYYNGSTLITTSSIALSVSQWYWIGLKIATATAEQIIQVDGVGTGASITNSGYTASQQLGCSGTEASAIDVYFDDVIADSATFLAPSKVIDLLPTADSAIGTGWTLGSGGTSNLFGGVDNQPPTAVADAGTTAQIRNAASAAASSYDATLQTYTVGGVAASSTILAVQPLVATAAPVATSAKLGKVGNVSNPAITTVALASGGTAAAFWSGVAGGTYPTGWKVSTGTLTTSPSVTLGTAPVMRVTQDTASTRIAMVAYMALRVAWTPPSGTPVTGTGAGAGTAATSGGTAAETMAGTGAGTGMPASASGTGNVAAVATTGTGAGTQAVQTATGSGAETISGAGAGSPPPASSSGTGTSLMAATGTGAGTQAVQTATGTALETIAGSGAGLQAVQTAMGSGASVLAATGTGAGVQAVQTATGTATETMTGTGAGTQTVQAGSGTGLFAVPVTGTGAGTQAVQTATGSGSSVAPGAIAGTGAGVQVPQSGAGDGLVSEEQPPVVTQGSTIFAPKLRVIAGSGGGVQARQSAKGRGRVNDDDLVVMAA